MKLLCHASMVLGEGCNTSLMSANSSKACFHSCLDMPHCSVIGHAYITCLSCANLIASSPGHSQIVSHSHGEKKAWDHCYVMGRKW